MKSLNEYIEEQLSDVKTKWHPKDGLFTEKDPKKIVDYLLKNSKDRGQAMKRLTFYMNRAGDKLSNKTVLNKAKDMLKENVNEKLVINKDYRVIDDKKCLMIQVLLWDTAIDDANKKIVMLNINNDCKIINDMLYLNYSSSKQPELKYQDKDKCYYWSMFTSAIELHIIGLVGTEAFDFLNNLCKGNSVPEKINICDYYGFAPNEICSLVYYDNNSKKYLHYNKNDINTLIDKLYE